MNTFSKFLIAIFSVLLAALTGLMLWILLVPAPVETEILSRSDTFEYQGIQYSIGDVYAPSDAPLFIEVVAVNETDQIKAINLSDWTYITDQNPKLPHVLSDGVSLESVSSSPDLIPTSLIESVKDNTERRIEPGQATDIVFVLPDSPATSSRLNLYNYSKSVETPLYSFVINRY